MADPSDSKRAEKERRLDRKCQSLVSQLKLSLENIKDENKNEKKRMRLAATPSGVRTVTLGLRSPESDQYNRKQREWYEKRKGRKVKAAASCTLDTDVDGDIGGIDVSQEGSYTRGPYLLLYTNDLLTLLISKRWQWLWSHFKCC